MRVKFRMMERMGFDRIVLTMLMVGIIYLMYSLVHRDNFFHTNDIWGHQAYIKHMLSNGLAPHEYRGQESWHPPTYYAVAAWFIDILPSAVEESSKLRVLSLLFYVVFIIYGLRTLRLVHPTQDINFYAGAALIIFWPSGVHTATNITNDVMLYAAWSVAFYHLVKWWQAGGEGIPMAACMATAIAFMVKSNAVVMLLTVGVCVLVQLVRRKIMWGALWGVQGIKLLGILLVALMINGWRQVIMLWQGQPFLPKQFGEVGRDKYDLEHFLGFDVGSFIESVFAFPEDPAFLNYFLKTLIFWEFRYDPTWAGQLISVCLLCFLALWIVFVLFIIMRRCSLFQLLPCFVALLGAYLSMIGFTLHSKMHSAQHARFVFPIIVPMSILYVHGMALIAKKRCAKVALVGVIVSAVFVILGGAVFLMADLTSYRR